jgi:hypothetical protein
MVLPFESEEKRMNRPAAEKLKVEIEGNRTGKGSCKLTV